MNRQQYETAVSTLKLFLSELSELLKDPEPSQELLLKLYKVRGKCADLIQYHREKGIIVTLK